MNEPTPCRELRAKLVSLLTPWRITGSGKNLYDWMLQDLLTAGADPARPGGLTLADIERIGRPEWTRHPGLALELSDPSIARPRLAAVVTASIPSMNDEFAALEAASVLAVLGDRAGLALLRRLAARPRLDLTQSGIEAFFVRADLALLGERVLPPAPVLMPRLHDAVDACVAARVERRGRGDRIR